MTTYIFYKALEAVSRFPKQRNTKCLRSRNTNYSDIISTYGAKTSHKYAQLL